MFWYKCSIIRERKIPGFKPIANDTMLFTRSTVRTGSVVDPGYI